MLLLHYPTPLEVPDPMRLDPDCEQDEPLASDRHHREQWQCIFALEARFAGPECYVAGDRWLRLSPHNPLDRVQPDLLVSLEVPDRNRTEYNPWEEGKAPDLLGEFLSPSSLQADLSAKPRRYAELGVREYFVFNPGGAFPEPPIQGWRLQASGGPQALPVAADGSVPSEVLPIRFALQEGMVIVLDRETGEPLSREQATTARLWGEIEARRREEEARQQAEAEVRRLQSELERLRRECS